MGGGRAGNKLVGSGHFFFGVGGSCFCELRELGQSSNVYRENVRVAAVKAGFVESIVALSIVKRSLCNFFFASTH